jgi:hypothetical protein
MMWTVETRVTVRVGVGREMILLTLTLTPITRIMII